MKLHGKTELALLFLVLILLVLTTVGCVSQMRGTRLEPKEIGLDLSLSGPIAQMDGVYPIPFPSLGVKYGLSDRVQLGVSYIPVLHVIRPVVILQLLEGNLAYSRLIPSVDLAIEVGVRTDFSDFIFYPRLDLATIWHLEPVSPYIEVGFFSDSQSLMDGKSPLISINIGANWQILPWLDMNAGLMYWGINKDYGYATTSGDASGTPWVLTPNGMGAVGITLGFGLTFEDK